MPGSTAALMWGSMGWGGSAGKRVQDTDGELKGHLAAFQVWNGDGEAHLNKTRWEFPPLPTLTHPQQIPPWVTGLTFALVEKMEMEMRTHPPPPHS